MTTARYTVRAWDGVRLVSETETEEVEATESFVRRVHPSAHIVTTDEYAAEDAVRRAFDAWAAFPCSECGCSLTASERAAHEHPNEAPEFSVYRRGVQWFAETDIGGGVATYRAVPCVGGYDFEECERP